MKSCKTMKGAIQQRTGPKGGKQWRCGNGPWRYGTPPAEKMPNKRVGDLRQHHANLFHAEREEKHYVDLAKKDPRVQKLQANVDAAQKAWAKTGYAGGPTHEAASKHINILTTATFHVAQAKKHADEMKKHKPGSEDHAYHKAAFDHHDGAAGK